MSFGKSYFCPKNLLTLFAALLFLVSVPGESWAGKKGKKGRAKQAIKSCLQAQRLLGRLNLSAVEISAFALAGRLVDSDGDGLPDLIEGSKSGLSACDSDSDDDGKDDGEDEDSGASSSSSSGSNSSSSSSSSSGGSSSGGSSSGSSSSSSGGSSSSSGDD